MPLPRTRPVTPWLNALPYALIAAGALLRIVPHPPNFQPVDALALFGGGVLALPWGGLVPLAAMALSDAALGYLPGADQSAVWVYGSFVLITLLGAAALRRRRTPLRVAGTALGASVLFFAVTNFGVWLGTLYPHTLAGLRADYIAAIPFYRATALSDLGYSLALFGIYDGALRLAHRRMAHAGVTLH
jgi:MYXO-CTERM domain-containing protein